MMIEEIMSNTVVTVEMDDSIKEVKHIFEHTNFHHLLVVESKRLVGVISDRDYLKSISPNIGTPAETIKDSATLNKRAHQIMSRKPITLQPSSSVYEAIDVFNKHKISCIPIIDNENRPVGILSWRDIIYLMKNTGD